MRPFKWVLPAALMLAPSITVLADKTSEVEALEAKCEQQREANIKRCTTGRSRSGKADATHDPAYCERCWKDYGNGVRTAKGVVTPCLRMDTMIILR